MENQKISKQVVNSHWITISRSWGHNEEALKLPFAALIGSILWRQVVTKCKKSSKGLYSCQAEYIKIIKQNFVNKLVSIQNT